MLHRDFAKRIGWSSKIRNALTCNGENIICETYTVETSKLNNNDISCFERLGMDVFNNNGFILHATMQREDRPDGTTELTAVFRRPHFQNIQNTLFR